MQQPLIRAISAKGTRLYIDSASAEEIAALARTNEGAAVEDVVGNTTNQKFIHGEVDQHRDRYSLERWLAGARELHSLAPHLDYRVLVFTVITVQIGREILRTARRGNAWEVSLPLHMNLCSDQESARDIGQYVRWKVPSALVKVAFTPYDPRCVLIARDLENLGVPVNFTCTFSARQVVAASLLANVTRANIFLDRLNRGLSATSLDS